MFRTLTRTAAALLVTATLLSTSTVMADPLYFAGPNPSANNPRPPVAVPGTVQLSTVPQGVYIPPPSGGNNFYPAVIPLPPKTQAGTVALNVQSGGRSSGGSIVNTTSSGSMGSPAAGVAGDGVEFANPTEGALPAVTDFVFGLTDRTTARSPHPNGAPQVRPPTIRPPQRTATPPVITAPRRPTPFRAR